MGVRYVDALPLSELPFYAGEWFPLYIRAGQSVSMPLWASLGCQKLWGQQLLPAWAQTDFGGSCCSMCCSREGSASLRSQASPLQLIPEPISAPSSSHWLPLWSVLGRGGFTPRSPWKVVIRFWSSQVKQSWSVSFAKAGALLPQPLKDKTVIQTNPCCFSKQQLCVQHSWGLGAGQGRAACCFLWEERWKYVFPSS